MNTIIDKIDLWTTAQELKTSNRGRSASNQSLLGIKKLRELILELAVRGKLVSQDPNDEPASELLKKIEAEKRRFIKEGKIKKQETLPEVGEDERPFDLPNGWEWIRFGNAFEVTSSKRIHVNDYVSDGIPFFRSKEIGELMNGKPISTDIFISIEKFAELKALSGFPNVGDLMLTSVGSIGNSWICDGRDFYYKDGNITKIGSHQFANMKYVQFFINAPLFSLQVINTVSGTAYNALTIVKLNNLFLPLPPLAEQHRIVAKVDELMALCDELENQQTNSNVAHETLVATLLGSLNDAENSNSFDESWQRIANHFDILFTTEHSIDQLKQTILQLAVMGKLVPQNPADEPAAELLKKIAKEKAKLIKEGKIKKQAFLPEITNEEKQFELPERWAWVRLQDVTTLITDGKHGDCQNQFGSGYYFLSAKDINDGKLNYEFGREINFTEFQETHNRTNLIAGDICMVNTGATVGKLAVAADDPKTNRTTFQKSVAVIKPVRGFLESQYLKIFLLSEAKKMLTKSGGSAINNLLLGDLKIKPFALPPHSEQQRIVSKVEELFALCDGLKERLVEAQTLQNQMAVAVVEQALEIQPKGNVNYTINEQISMAAEP